MWEGRAVRSICGRIPALAGLILAVSITAGCGSGDETTPSSGPPDVALNQTSTAAVDSADSSATKDPARVGVPVLNELEPLRRAQDETTVPAIRGSEGLTIPQWLSTVDADIANYWQKQFNDAGYRYKPPKEVILDRKLTTGCGPAQASIGPYYCGNDGAIYLPVKFFDTMSNRFGDAAVAVVVAHENGHRVQDLLGLFRAPLLSAQIELQADCLAGVWASTVYRRGLLEPGDIDEILGIIHISGDAQGVPIKAEGAHGNATLRQNFFAQGYDGGDPGACPPPKKSQLRG
jgi:predicted metalloprotease